jgi:nucleotide-binding universal stress UspA family protein
MRAAWSMYTHILIATDGSELASKAVSTGIALAKVLNLKVTIVTVTEPWHAVVTGEAALGFPRQEYETSGAASARRILTEASDIAGKSGVDCALVHVPDQYPSDGILDAAKRDGCDLIVMASHGRRGLTRLLLGSQAVRVLTHSAVPVLICR